MSEPAWFVKARERGDLVVSDPPKLDLELYLANYKGKTRILRLLHIGRTSSYLSNEALRNAVQEAKASKDVELYLKVVELYHEIFPIDHTSETDTEWLARTQRETAAETQRLENELKGYKNNLIKESIRMAYDDMGRHYQQIGAVGEAIQMYQKEREYCQLPAHVSIMTNRLINAGIESKNWLSVEANVQKLRTVTGARPDSDSTEAKLSAAQGLADLSTQRYKNAAITLLACNPIMVTGKLEGGSGDESYGEVISPNDVATYGALCALATMNRDELQKQVLENTGFRNYLELEPHLRRAISSFIAGKYSQCLDILQAYRTDYIVDMYLAPHYDRLVTMIRNKSIVQYFIPFSKVTFSALATAFKTTTEDIISTSSELIQKKALKGTLDLEHGLLVANVTESRADMFKSAMKSSQDYEKALQAKLLKMAVIHTNLEVNNKQGPMMTDMLQQQGGFGKQLRSGRNGIL